MHGGVKVKRSRLTCDEWKCITSKRFKQISVNKEFFTGIVAGLFIDEVTTPQVWKYRGKDVVVCDKDMKWVLIMPEKEHYLITAMLDKNDEVVVWYIDIIASSALDKDGVISYEDLYLDLIVYPDGNIIVDDMDELELALKKNDISKELFDLAIETSNSLKSNFLSDVKKIEELTKKCFKEVRSIL